jgi:AraC family transcriptional regulator
MAQGKCEVIRQYLRGDSTRRFSSSKLSWPSALLEQHTVYAGERAETKIDHYVLSLYLDSRVTRCDRPDRGGSFLPRLIEPRSMMLHAPGALSPARTYTPSNLLLCTLDKTLLDEARDEMRDERRGASRNAMAVKQTPFFDPSVRQLLILLAKEAKMGGTSGMFYVEHLLHALAARLITSGTSNGVKRNISAEKLPSAVLRRLLDRMHSDRVNNLSLTSLATEAGYSKRQLLRVFRASTGLSPYQYLLRLRLDRAKQLMRNSTLSLLDIAIESGFNSNAHLTNAFRQHVGVTPSHFRRSLYSKQRARPANASGGAKEWGTTRML